MFRCRISARPPLRSPLRMLKPAAFFDLDLTLIDANSAMLWAQHERSRGFISRKEMAQASLWTMLYYLSIVDIEKAYQTAVAAYRGSSRSELDARTRAWFQAEVAHRARPGALRAVDWHRSQGHPLVLLTSSTCFGAAAAAEHWGFDGWLANDFYHDAQGKLTGAVHQPLCYAEGKVHHATHYADAHGVSLSNSYFYSDSYSDLPMLEAVGHPKVVCPDPRLRWAARRRGWDILAW